MRSWVLMVGKRVEAAEVDAAAEAVVEAGAGAVPGMRMTLVAIMPVAAGQPIFPLL